MSEFPVDAPKRRVVRALEQLGFRVVREGNHIIMSRHAPPAATSVLTLPNHARIQGSTLRRACLEAHVSREDFLAAFNRS